MLYSIAAALMCYYGIMFVIGVLVNAMAIEESLITLAVVCFIGAYLTRAYSRLVFRFAMAIGIAVTTMLVAIWFLLPILAGRGNAWVTIIAIFAGFAVYVATRHHIIRYFRRMTAPPFGREWCRWLFAFLA